MSSSARIQKMIEDSIFRSNERSSSYYKGAAPKEEKPRSLMQRLFGKKN